MMTNARLERLQGSNDIAEDVADRRAKQGQDDDHDNRDQNQDQSVLYEALTFFTWQIKHDTLPLIS
jgi:hypothetical protein